MKSNYSVIFIAYGLVALNMLNGNEILNILPRRRYLIISILKYLQPKFESR